MQKPAAGNGLQSYFAATQLPVRDTKRTSNIIGCGVKPHDFDLSRPRGRNKCVPASQNSLLQFGNP
uniref:Uncharacterized protein n=1 Tax=Shewanella decolorationis TaxID=256839 RepID=A0A5B8R1V9_9GAMM